MGHGINRLTAAALRKTMPGLYHDGLGLHLQVAASKDGKRVNRSWLFRYAVNGRDRWMGLGGTHTVDLNTAREFARQARLQRLQGVDPIEARRNERTAKLAESIRAITFQEAALRYMAAHRSTWSNEQHVKDWPRSLAKHVLPTLGKIDVKLIDTPVVVKSLEQVWATAPKTAAKVRGRIEAVLDWCSVSGFRKEGDNPARWGGHLEHVFAAPNRRQVNHHPALPWKQAPQFMAKLRATDSVIARALEFTTLCAVRRDEARLATWSEVDLDNAVWTIGRNRMKSGREHRVPLSPRAVKILREMQAIRSGEFVFPGERGGGAPFNAKGPRDLLARLGHADITQHGFRSTFRTWAGEQTSYAHDICEAALAHSQGKLVEAYQRGDLFEKRRRLMGAWATYCASTPAAEGAVVLGLRPRSTG